MPKRNAPYRIPCLSLVIKAEFQMIKFRAAVAVGPPKARMLHRELGKIRGRKGNGLCFTGLQGHRLFEFYTFKRTLKRSLLDAVRCIVQIRFDGDVCARRIGKWQSGNDLRIVNRHRARGAQKYVLPDAGVAVANGRDPVPALGGFESGRIQAKFSAVIARDRILAIPRSEDPGQVAAQSSPPAHSAHPGG